LHKVGVDSLTFHDARSTTHLGTKRFFSHWCCDEREGHEVIQAVRNARMRRKAFFLRVMVV
jgi:hypothetical protein